jgi:hypothetical protein
MKPAGTAMKKTVSFNHTFLARGNQKYKYNGRAALCGSNLETLHKDKGYTSRVGNLEALDIIFDTAGITLLTLAGAVRRKASIT